MADLELKTDEEKAEEIKKWWHDNGMSVVIGVLIAVVGVFGWNQWKQHQLTQSEEASALYAQIKGNKNVIEQLKKNYSSTPYASMAALMAAKLAAESGSDEKVVSELKWVIDNTSDNEILIVANLRLARMYITNNQLLEAKNILASNFDESYLALVSELQGDLFVAKNDIKSAIESYDKAIRLSSGGAPEYLQMKRDSISEGS